MMKSIVTASLVLFALSLSSQVNFSSPKHSDGSRVANEKLEMLEKYWKRYNAYLKDGKIEAKPPKQRVNKRASGEVMVGESGYFESELHAIVNPLDPNNIVVGVMRFDFSNLLEPLKFSIYVTKDLGDSWTKSDFEGMHPSRIPLGGGDPMFAFDDKGVLYFSWLRLDVELIPTDLDWGMYVAKSEDGGLTWTELEKPIEYNRATDLEELSDLEVASDKQWMSSDLSDDSPHKGNVYISYVNVNPSQDPKLVTYNIMFKRKLASEDNFGSDLGDEGVVIFSSTERVAQFANIEVDNDGTIYIIFLGDLDDRSHIYTMLMSKSTDGGKSFSTPTTVTDITYPDFGSGWMPVDGISDDRTYPCPQLAVDRSGGSFEGRLYTTFTAYGIDTLESDGLDIYLSFSDDQGDSWSEPKIVNNDLDVEKHQFYSSITVDDKGRPVLAWYDRRSDLGDDGMTDYYLGFSDDGGESFEQFPVTEESSDFVTMLSRSGDFGVGEYNEVVTVGDYLIPFWADGRSNGEDIVVYAYFFNTEGTGVDKQVLLSDKITLTEPSPNPTDDYFIFNLELKESSEIIIKLLDQEGRIVRKILEEKKQPGVQSFIVETADLSNGMYYLTVESTFGNVSRKVVVD